MGRTVTRAAAWELFEAVQQNPGLKRAELCRRLGWNQQKMGRRLAWMERYGLLLYEGRSGGRLYVYHKYEEVGECKP
jgi:DNA-binding IclR family transcriptional regulator